MTNQFRYLLVLLFVFNAIVVVHYNWAGRTCGTSISSHSSSNSSSSRYTSENRNRLVLFVQVGADRFKARENQRKFCWPVYEKYGIKDKFFLVGRPSIDKRNPSQKVQGQIATPEEQQVARWMFNESEKYQDLFVLGHRDYYRDKTEKIFEGLDHIGLLPDSKYLVKTDDDYCADMTLVTKVIEEHEREHKGEELYFGYYQFKGNEYDIMRGADKTAYKFMSGHIIVLSRGLVEAIVEDRAHSLLWQQYGASSDDANIGRWVNYTMEKRGTKVHFHSEVRARLPVPPGQS